MSELNTFKKERMNKMAMIWRKTVLGYYTHTHTFLHLLSTSHIGGGMFLFSQ